ncbi:sensor histidine kinase [Actinoplanes sp. N902-109]|uniref:sensor histidine kinase n=1 Tax=Actinoplanes sp. (strain N902-109) TaxID=649831 RepID=UPI0003294554|nr:ATP-binding protein [Actinoplanes sp. N902-109]AGL20662.1 two-component system histidine kinase [Actinoplanes sp. N902-109]
MDSADAMLVSGLRRYHERIVAQFARSLRQERNPLVADPVALRQCREHARSILVELETCLDPAPQPVSATDGIPAQIGETRASSLQSPGISFAAAATLFSTIMRTVGEICTDPEQAIAVAVTLNRIVNQRVGAALMSYSRYLLDNVHRAHVQERFRIGRELHDRLGNDVGAALQLSRLAAFYLPDSQERTDALLQDVSTSLSRAVGEIRTMTFQLRSLVGGRPLKDVLTECTDQLALTVPVDIRLQGDECWIPDYVGEELFLVIREAVRNAGRHSAAARIQITVVVTPTEAVASVVDDGVGFDTSLPPTAERTGLSSMQERVRLFGGSLEVTSEPDAGTRVRVRVPLPGERR